MSLPVSNRETFLRLYRDPILAIAEKHGAYNVRIFGSLARDQLHPESDVDFLVDFNPIKHSPWFPMGLIEDLENLLQTKVDVATPDMLKDRIRSHILSEAIPL